MNNGGINYIVKETEDSKKLISISQKTIPKEITMPGMLENSKPFRIEELPNDEVNPLVHAKIYKIIYKIIYSHQMAAVVSKCHVTKMAKYAIKSRKIASPSKISTYIRAN